MPALFQEESQQAKAVRIVLDAIDEVYGDKSHPTLYVYGGAVRDGLIRMAELERGERKPAVSGDLDLLLSAKPEKVEEIVKHLHKEKKIARYMDGVGKQPNSWGIYRLIFKIPRGSGKRGKKSLPFSVDIGTVSKPGRSKKSKTVPIRQRLPTRIPRSTRWR